LTTLTIDARQSRPGTAAEVSHCLLRFDFARLVGMPGGDFHGIFMGFSWDFHGISCDFMVVWDLMWA